jgi:hypothetical protein
MGFISLDDSLRSPFGPPLRAFNALRAFVPHSREWRDSIVAINTVSNSPA